MVPLREGGARPDAYLVVPIISERQLCGHRLEPLERNTDAGDPPANLGTLFARLETT